MADTGVRITGGRWYYVVTIASMGMLAWVPFLHAAQRLGRNRPRVLAAVYGAVVLTGYVVFGSAPVDGSGTPTGVAADVSLGVILVAIVMACVQQQPLRTAVYGRRAAPPPDAAPIAQVQQARRRREEARRLAERDPLMARELRIGRPDLPSTYDDGGLVDLNAVSAEVLARACDLPESVAQQVVAARDALHGFSEITEAIVYAEVTGSAADVLRDRGIVLPR